MAFMRVMKVSRDQHSACAQALLEGTLDANLNKALKEIPIEIIQNAKSIFASALKYAKENRKFVKNEAINKKRATDH
ncbi:17991_t:CDS:2 [Entrophospora sp. SA101]|nr:11907_t:CDS:2 [Entrophospora sp. SA101]CAJ0636819.1 5070_t:CDS:2 [Entrophospora sp. SA101]CAJ0766269.1 17991_t:CDS:2 [Entrophospora sp. SA101]CAJ0911699.1 4815_t:CDS:2 [Entrophospora sp. SA101]CAJ0920371.1 17347_t:CDS:2 [Entrophospora sp. SA101]